MAQGKRIRLGTLRLQLQSLASLSAVSCGVGQRCSSDPVLLCLWRRLVAVAPIRLLAWESPYTVSTVLKKTKDKKKKKKKRKSQGLVLYISFYFNSKEQYTHIYVLTCIFVHIYVCTEF